MRAVLAVVVLSVIVGVSLLQAYRHKSALDSAYTKGAEQELAKSGSLQKEVDSLQDVLTIQGLSIQDSLAKTDAAYQTRIDSLQHAVTTRDSIIAFQKAQSKKAATQTHAAAVPVKKVDSEHQQILSYYKKRCESLPKDLSEYERKVAYAEIRTETAQKFAISITELNRLRSEHKLTY